jgi:hypothetical protein
MFIQPGSDDLFSRHLACEGCRSDSTCYATQSNLPAKSQGSSDAGSWDPNQHMDDAVWQPSKRKRRADGAPAQSHSNKRGLPHRISFYVCSFRTKLRRRCAALETRREIGAEKGFVVALLWKLDTVSSNHRMVSEVRAPFGRKLCIGSTTTHVLYRESRMLALACNRERGRFLLLTRNIDFLCYLKY